jgi:hypothetical protein
MSSAINPVGLLLEAFRRNPVAWFETHARIQTKDVGKPPDEPPQANEMQVEVGKAIAWCLANGIPIRLIILKPRQKGCSTVTVGATYALGRGTRMRTLVIGGQASQTDNLWKILRYYGQNDGFQWGNTWTSNSTTATCSNGTLWERETAGDKEAGRSGTYHAIIVTEPARWPTDGKKNAGDVLNSVLNCVPEAPGTLVIMESTANGPEGPFPATWGNAVTLDEMMAGERGNGYIKIFAPWFVFADSRTPLPPGRDQMWLRKLLVSRADKKALQVWDKHDLEPEQVYWYHQLLKKPECEGDPQKRDREYPTTPEDGFRASSPSRFNLDALEMLDEMAKANAHRIEYGTLELPPAQALRPVEHRDYGKTTFVPCNEKQAEFALVERPIIGCSYSISTDNAKGISLVTGDDTDCHAVTVIRDGYFDQFSELHPPEVVAALMPETRWDQTELAEFVARLAGYYGCCMVVPESNRAELLIAELRKRRVLLWRRQRPKDEVDLGKDTGLIGFETTGETKKMLVENLARHIRELNELGSGFRCVFPWILKELRTFVRHKDGTEGALRQRHLHDDFVMAIAIGYLTKASGTTCHRGAVSNVDPALMEEDEAEDRGMW